MVGKVVGLWEGELGKAGPRNSTLVRAESDSSKKLS